MRCISIIDVHADIHLYNNRRTQTDRISANFSSVTGSVLSVARMLCASVRNSSSVGGTSLLPSTNRCGNEIFQHFNIKGLTLPSSFAFERESHPDIRRKDQYALSFQAFHAA